MRQKGVVFTTSMSTKECADLFHTAAAEARGMSARVGQVAAKIRGNDQGGFFTPSFDSPFDTIDGNPDFAVGVHVAKFLNGAIGGGTTIHTYVDDAHDHREVQIISAHRLTGGNRSSGFARAFFEPFRAADQARKLTKDNIVAPAVS